MSTTRRVALLPDVPTIDEAGVKGHDMGHDMGDWFATSVPAGIPAPVVARLRELLIAGTRGAAARSLHDTTGSDAWTTTSEAGPSRPGYARPPSRNRYHAMMADRYRRRNWCSGMPRMPVSGTGRSSARALVR